MRDTLSELEQQRPRENSANAETTLRVLAGTLRSLIPQLEDLPPDMRQRIGGPGRRSLTNWHGRVLAQYTELRAAREARVAAEILHGGEPPPPPAS